MMFRSSQIIAVGGLLLATKMWVDICELLRQKIRMNSYSKISSCALEIMKILQEESHKRKNKILH